MTIVVGLAGIAFAVLFGLSVLRALREGQARFRSYAAPSRAEQPAGFWTVVALDSFATLVGLYVGFTALAASLQTT